MNDLAQEASGYDVQKRIFFVQEKPLLNAELVLCCIGSSVQTDSQLRSDRQSPSVGPTVTVDQTADTQKAPERAPEHAQLNGVD